MTKFYNLDVIISIGYRVKSQCGVQFRIWASKILKEYIKKGFAMDDDRLKELGEADTLRNYLKEFVISVRLKKLIAEQVQIYRRTNMVKFEKFSEIIQKAMNAYLNGMHYQ